MNSYTIYHSLLFLSLSLIFPVCNSVDKATSSSYEKEIILQRELKVSSQCQSYVPEKSIEELFFGGETPKLFATLNQDTLELNEFKLMNSEFSAINNVSFYVHFNSDGEIHKVETGGQHRSTGRAILKEIAESFVVQFPNEGSCHESGMISGIF